MDAERGLHRRAGIEQGANAPSLAHSGSQSLFFNNPVGAFGELAQTIKDVAGATYLLDYWMLSSPVVGQQNPDDFLSVDITDEAVTSIQDDLSTYEEISFTFVGTGRDTLTIDEQSNDGSFNIDDISITGPAAPGGVPEPANWALMIVGFGLTGALLRRRALAVG